MAAPKHDWYLAEWMKSLGKRQSDVTRDLGWNPARISLMARCQQQYTRDAVNELAAYLNLEPFELLLPPDRAMAIRGMRANAEQIVSIAHRSESLLHNELADAEYRRAKRVGKGAKTGTHD